MVPRSSPAPSTLLNPSDPFFSATHSNKPRCSKTLNNGSPSILRASASSSPTSNRPQTPSNGFTFHALPRLRGSRPGDARREKHLLLDRRQIHHRHDRWPAHLPDRQGRGFQLLVPPARLRRPQRQPPLHCEARVAHLPSDHLPRARACRDGRAAL